MFRPLLNEYREDIPNEAIRDRMTKLANCPDIPFPIRGAYRTFPLSSYIKRAYKGKIFALIADELHQYVLSVGRNFDHWVLQKKRLPGIPASRLCFQGDQGIIT